MFRGRSERKGRGTNKHRDHTFVEKGKMNTERVRKSRSKSSEWTRNCSFIAILSVTHSLILIESISKTSRSRSRSKSVNNVIDPSRKDYQIYQDALNYYRHDLKRYKDVHVLENPESSEEDKALALQRLLKAIEEEEADFDEV